MTNYKERHFDTAQDLWNALRPEEINNHINSNNLIYRGQANVDWGLEPNASRLVQSDTTIIQQIKYEVQLLVHFLDYCDKTGIQVPGHVSTTRLDLEKILNGSNDEDMSCWPSRKYYDILAFAQHYGVSTRLLDWSKRSFVAAYFSSSEAVKIIVNNLKTVDWTQNLSIWILEGENLNKYNLNFSSAGLDETQFHLNIINVPSSVNSHIAAQQGCFTIFRDVSKDFNDKEDWYVSISQFSKEKTIDRSEQYSEFLSKWTLPYSEAHKLLQLCELYNVNAASVYPTATGVGQAVKDLMNIQIIQEFLSP